MTDEKGTNKLFFVFLFFNFLIVFIVAKAKEEKTRQKEKRNKPTNKQTLQRNKERRKGIDQTAITCIFIFQRSKSGVSCLLISDKVRLNKPIRILVRILQII